MPGVHFDFRWLDTASSPENAEEATLASLEIRVGENIVTSVLERRREPQFMQITQRVTVPLLRVAEWLASNWWHLWYELPAIDDERPGFEARHDLARAGAGLLLPRLEITRDGDRMHLQWSRWSPKRSGIQFVTEGQADVSREALESQFRALIEAVLERVGSLSRGTGNCERLKRNWEAINSLGRKEVEFAQAAALLGEDPSDMQESVAKDIAEFWEGSPPSIRDEALASSSAESLASVGEWLNDSLARLEESYHGMRWSAVREEVPADRTAPSETRGRGLATNVRILLDLAGRRFDFEQSGPLAVPFLESAPPCGRIQGLVDAHSPACIAAPLSGTDKRHLQARALGDYFGRSEPVPGILNSLATARQAQSRAFADEFLAPASLMRSRLEGKRRDEAAIDELAREFGVSNELIWRQLRSR